MLQELILSFGTGSTASNFLALLEMSSANQSLMFSLQDLPDSFPLIGLMTGSTVRVLEFQ